MASFKSLGMAAAVSARKDITIKQSWFSTKAVYTPSGSPVKALVLEYSMSEGEKVEALQDMPLEKMADYIELKGKPRAGVNGNFRLEVCMSKDRCFCAVQLFRYADFCYRPLFEPRFYEGAEAEYIAQLP